MSTTTAVVNNKTATTSSTSTTTISTNKQPSMTSSNTNNTKVKNVRLDENDIVVGLWIGSVSLLVPLISSCLHYFILFGRLAWILSLVVSMRDGGIHLTSVEYNYQTKCIVGMIVYTIQLYVFSTQISILPELGYLLSCIVISAAHQSFCNSIHFLYCMPQPQKLTFLGFMDSTFSLPILLLSIVLIEYGYIQIDKDSSNTINNQTIHMIVYGYFLFKLTRYYFNYQEITNKHSTTVPEQNFLTVNLEKTCNKVDATPPDSNGKHIWKLYGNTYDLSSFVNSHPGGKEAILLGSNREDCTTLFQTYHPFNIQKAKSVLQKYRIHIDNTNNSTSTAITTKNDELVSPNTTHKNDLFYDELVKRVAKHLKQNNVDPIQDRTPTKQRYCYYIFLIISTILSLIAHCRGSIIGGFLLGVLGSLNLSLGHDGGHYSISHNPIINDIALWGMSFIANPIMWQHQHTYAHHTFTNEFDKDPDLHHFDMFLKYHKRFVPLTGMYKLQTKKLFVLLAYAWTCFGECYHIPMRFILERSLYGAVEWSDRSRVIRNVLFFVHFTAYTLVLMVYPFFLHESKLYAFVAALVPIVTTSVLFAFASQLNHYNEYCMLSHDGGDPNKVNRHPDAKDSYAALQVETSNDFCPQNTFVYIMSSGLSYQIEHHLFPGLNPCHYPLIQPIVEQTCKDYGVIYRSYPTFREAFNTTFVYLTKLAQE